MSTTFLVRFDCNTEGCDYHTVLAGLGRVEATEPLQKMGWLLLQYGTFTPSNDRHLCPGCAERSKHDKDENPLCARIVAFAGPLMAGKTTAARHLVENYEYELLSALDYCRVWQSQEYLRKKIVLDDVNFDVLRRLKHRGQDAILVWVDRDKPNTENPFYKKAEVQISNSGTLEAFKGTLDTILRRAD